jgi:hypothetical protein
MTVSLPPVRKWAGVRLSAPSFGNKGRELMAASIWDKMVFNNSSSSSLSPRTFLKHRLVVPTMRSHYPPHQAARGAMNLQVILLMAKNCDVLGEARIGETSFNSLQPARNVWALSE